MEHFYYPAVLFIGIVLFFSSAHGQLCPPGWLESPVTDYCFQFNTYDVKKSWSEARAACVAQQGDLFSYSSQGEKDWLKKQMLIYQARDSRTWQWWSGYSDNSGSWRWEDGNNDTSLVTWSPGEPNNYAGIEHCGEVVTNGKMNDNNCDNVMPYICKSMKGKPSKCPPDWQDVEGSCYKHFETELNWNEARTDCQRYGADLPDIQTDAEQQYLLDTVKCKGKPSWIGLKAKVTTTPTNKFQWVTGDELGIGSTARWAQRQPFVEKYNFTLRLV